MTREEILEQLRAAKRAHTQWLSDAMALIAGLAAEQDHVPVSHRHCDFGQWYHGPGRGLASLPGYQSIDAPHQELHRIYAEVFDLLFGQAQRPLLAKVLSRRGHPGKRQRDQAKELMQDLLAASRSLLETIAVLEQEIRELPEGGLPALDEAALP